MWNMLLGFSLVGFGAFFGGCLRGMLGGVFNTEESPYPWGTLLANLIGCYLIGIITAMVADKTLTNYANLWLSIGFCGGLTTFSTFSLEVYQQFLKRESHIAWLYWIGSTLLCLIFVFLGAFSHHIL